MVRAFRYTSYDIAFVFFVTLTMPYDPLYNTIAIGKPQFYAVIHAIGNAILYSLTGTHAPTQYQPLLSQL